MFLNFTMDDLVRVNLKFLLSSIRWYNDTRHFLSASLN